MAAEAPVDVELGVVDTTGATTGDVVIGMEPQDSEAALIVDMEDELEEQSWFLRQVAKLIVPVFYVTIVGVLVLWIAGFAADVKNMFYGILILNLFTAIVGAWSVYMYGCVSEQIEKFKMENGEYQESLKVLGTFREGLTEEVDELQKTSEAISSASDELQTQVDAFDPLLDELKKICGDNEDIAKMLDSTNSIFTDMQKAIVQNERANLLRVYYDVSFRDEDAGLSKGEYRRLLAKMSKKYRAMFEAHGSFEEIAGEDEIIDLQEYTAVLEKVLAECEDELAERFGD